jgi:nucleotide-binding universal stress UspA family protein
MTMPFAQLGEEMLDRVLAAVAAEAKEVAVERAVVEGAAAEALLGEAADAALLVVGSRGVGGFASLLLGSVSQQCAHHAPCPVVIVRRIKRDR